MWKLSLIVTLLIGTCCFSVRSSPSKTVGDPAPGAPWYAKYSTIQVDPTSFPGDSGDEWATTRMAYFLTKDNPDLAVSVPFYTAVYGAKDDTLVKVKSIAAPGNGQGGATHTFFRAVEHLHVTDSSIWSTSQGCAVRTSVFDQNLALSNGGQDYASGGFISDSSMNVLDFSIQQQFLVRSSEIKSVQSQPASWNLNLAGCDHGSIDSQVYMNVVDQIPQAIQKPYLAVDGQGAWHVKVPGPQTTKGYVSAPPMEKIIPISECAIWDPASPFTMARCVIVTPGLYHVNQTITFTYPGQVVLGLGFATFLCETNAACLLFTGAGAHVAGIVADAGVPSTTTTAVQPLIEFDSEGGLMHDVFARIYASQGSDGQVAHTRADVFLHVKADNVMLDNTWLWHADHDSLAPYPTGQIPYQSDLCHSGHALVVDGANFLVYNLMAEHTQDDIAVFNGENASVYMFQCEVPYYLSEPDHSWGPDKVAYRVSAKTHYGTGLGGYITNPSWIQGWQSFTQTNMFYFQPTNVVDKVFAWINPPGGQNKVTNVYSTSAGETVSQESCNCAGCERKNGDQSACYVKHLPTGPSPSPPSPTPPSNHLCPANSLPECMELCPSHSRYSFKACVEECSTRCVPPAPAPAIFMI